jgi:uncharacterized membrane protein YqjE
MLRNTSWPPLLSNLERLVFLAAWVAAACAVLVIVQGLTARPTGYLHSWNQISALTAVEQLYRDPTSIFHPQGTIVRVTVPGAPVDLRGESQASLSVSQSHTSQHFLNYQEFPLYHSIAALVAWCGDSLGISLEVAARLVTIAFWALQWGALRRLVRERKLLERGVMHLLYGASFAITFYGQAIMSDIAMAAIGAWAIERAVRWRLEGRRARLLVALGLVGLSAITKSFGLIFALPVAAIVWPQLTSWRERVGVLVGLAVAALPVCGWHLYAAFQGGYNEVSSHSVAQKLATVSDPRFYKSLWRDYTHFVGLIPGVTAILSLGWWCVVRRQRLGTVLGLSPWLVWWSIAVVPYAIITLDKLIDHEYYLLPFALPLIVCVAHAVAYTVCRARLWWCGVLLIVAVGAQLAITYRSVRKAQRENPDVVVCADVIRQATAPEDIVAFLSDTQRYNSLAYYSDRRGLHVEEFAFPVDRYVHHGAQVVVIALSAAQQDAARRWVTSGRRKSRDSSERSEARNVELVAEAKSTYDFRGSPRMCEVYRIRGGQAREK